MDLSIGELLYYELYYNRFRYGYIVGIGIIVTIVVIECFYTDVAPDSMCSDYCVDIEEVVIENYISSCVYNNKFLDMGIGEFLSYCGGFVILSWLSGLILSKVFGLLEGERANSLFILRGGIIVVCGMLFYLWLRSL